MSDLSGSETGLYCFNPVSELDEGSKGLNLGRFVDMAIVLQSVKWDFRTIT